MGRFRIICAAIIPLVSSNSAEAQISDSSSMVEMYTACIKEGIASGEVSLRPASRIRFSCQGDTAEVFFKKLGQYQVESSEVTNKLGKFQNRAFDDPDTCWHKIENPDGSAANEYRCNINLRGPGAVLSKEPVSKFGDSTFN